MYMIEDFINTAKGDKEWPSDAHRIVAQNICLFNPEITTMDSLKALINQIFNVPIDKIKTVTYADFINNKYGE